MNIETEYLRILEKIINTGIKTSNRTGVDTYKIPPTMVQHDMSEGFPILTTKKVAWKTLKVELEGFIKGVTSKKWFQERGCKIWNEWANPNKVNETLYAMAEYKGDTSLLEDDVLRKKVQFEEDDLGPCIYGASWRNFHDPEATIADHDEGTYNLVHIGQKIDQLQNIVDTLKNNPEDRRMICLAWNPLGLNYTALPPCHYSWQVMKRGEYLDLIWTQRSVDSFLGLTFNIASYGLLLHLLAKEAGLKEGILSGSLADLHLYENHIEQAKEQLSRKPYKLPKVKTENFESIFNWEYNDSKLIGYDHHLSIKAEVAV